MSVEPESKLTLMNLESDHHEYLRRMSNRMMMMNKGSKLENCPSFSQGGHHVKTSKIFRYFTLESMLLLVCLTASLLILPLVLPPLPPPPFMLLLIPIFIFGLLMLLAFMPRDIVTR